MAQTFVRVRAECRIELRTERRPGETVVVGVLRDDLGAALADREVLVSATPDDARQLPTRQTPRTDADGRFAAPFALDTGGYRIGAVFAGDADHDKVEVERVLDLSLADVDLRVGVPQHGWLRLDQATHDVSIDARSDEGGAGLSIELTDELGRLLGRGRTDANGRLGLQIRSADLGPPAAGRIVARSLADTRRAEAQTEVPVVRVGNTSVVLARGAEEVHAGDAIPLAGRLRDHHGAGIGRAAVGLYRAGQAEPVATVLTGRDGRFDGRVEMPPDVEELSFVARFESDAPWRASSDSAPVRVRRIGGAATPWPWLALTTTVTALVVWWLTRRGRRDPGREADRAPVIRPPGVELAARRGLRPDRHDAKGSVLDARDEEPIAGAVVTLSRETEERPTLLTDAEGRFAALELAAGTWTLAVSAPGYATIHAALVLPHRGEWSGLRIRLASLRGRALDAVLPVASEVLSGRAASAATPREIEGRLRGHARAGGPARTLARAVEQAAFAEDPPTDALVGEAESARDATLAALRERSDG